MTPILFDFNGTMFDDGRKHKRAWGMFLKEKLGRDITEEEFHKYIYGPQNTEIIRRYFGEHLSLEEQLRLAEEKESVYRNICWSDPDTLRLVRGLPELLDELSRRGHPMNIASCSYPANFDFYFEAFGLSKWFDRETVAWDDGVIAGKPDPALFLLGAKKLGVDIHDCVIVEDSFSGVKAARRANCKTVVAITTSRTKEDLLSTGCVDIVIPDFTAFPLEIL